MDPAIVLPSRIMILACFNLQLFAATNCVSRNVSPLGTSHQANFPTFTLRRPTEWVTRCHGQFLYFPGIFPHHSICQAVDIKADRSKKLQFWQPLMFRFNLFLYLCCHAGLHHPLFYPDLMCLVFFQTPEMGIFADYMNLSTKNNIDLSSAGIELAAIGIFFNPFTGNLGVRLFHAILYGQIMLTIVWD